MSLRYCLRPTQGSSWGYFKVNFEQSLSTFGNACPQNGCKNEPLIPPRRAFCGGEPGGACIRARRQLQSSGSRRGTLRRPAGTAARSAESGQVTPKLTTDEICQKWSHGNLAPKVDTGATCHTEVDEHVSNHALTDLCQKTGESHSVEFEGFVASKFGGLRDQICTTFGPKVNYVLQVDFS